jgi:hypothetical protein
VFYTSLKEMACPGETLPFQDKKLQLESDCRLENVRFLVTASCLKFSNPYLQSSNETGLHPGIQEKKKHLPDLDRCQKAIGGTYLKKM